MSGAENNFYIGSPNVVVLCIDRCRGERLEGHLCHAYTADGIAFQDLEQAIVEMEKLFDALNFPMRGNKERSFLKESEDRRNKERGFSEGTERRWNKRERMKKLMDDSELKKQHGDLGTFIVRVKYRQHNSWQGQVVWVEKNIKQNFRSVLELIKMIDGVVGTEEEPRTISSEAEG